MSILSHIKGALTGAIKGFASGGITGAITGGVGGLVGGFNNGNATGIGTLGTLAAAVQPGRTMVSLPVLSTANTWSASNIVANVGKVAAVGAGAVARRLPAVAAAVGAYQLGSALYDAAGNLVGHRKRRRRMNPMNARAARRAIRRIKGARKMLQSIERQLPKQRVTSRRTSSSSGRQEFIRQG